MAAAVTSLSCFPWRLLEADGVAAECHRHMINLDMRYLGQSFTLAIPWSCTYNEWTPLRRLFDARHRETFGYEDPDNDAEIVNIRLVSIGAIDKPEIGLEAAVSDDPLLERRPVWFGGWTDCPVYRREAMGIGFAVTGPSIVEEAGGTSVIPPSWRGMVTAEGALLCEMTD